LIRFLHNDFLKMDQARLSDWLQQIANDYGHSIDQLDYNFVDTERMLSLNQQFLSHDTHTDIITFDYSSGMNISAEAFISCPALLNNAQELGQSLDNETLRLLAHALLHCMGFRDKTLDEKKAIRKEEDRCINLFHVKH
jgi:probable rRNA maturation factor